ncbi:methyltransferase-like protein 27 isoform X2 [Bufo gargarizans]|uniref:methyltransferase-like protein 27 isoform X2 n=1 Tax=Bufo bufo TaxID=8384 RepID=UPI001ABDFAC3|nr:methyltransferase-like protein 27 isoform X2 [Bufo bufo]XP_044139869.1 methyltransferase-like protein 27 isoform X2 [Bufo gargarizans]
MADCGKRLQEVRDVIAAAHKDCSVLEKLQFYDQWATQYEELQRCGFQLFHGLDGSAGMLEVAKKKDLYQELKQSMLGQGPLPCDSEKYDAVIIVGALSDGQVPVLVLPELLRVTKPGGFVCMTTRSNISNLQYKAELEEELSSLQYKGFWEQVLVEEVEQWEKATSEKEINQESDYIPGVIFIYRKMSAPSIVS